MVVRFDDEENQWGSSPAFEADFEYMVWTHIVGNRPQDECELRISDNNVWEIQFKGKFYWIALRPQFQARLTEAWLTYTLERDILCGKL